MGEGGVDGPTPIGSTIAFQHLMELGIGADSTIVQRGIRYFLTTFDEEHQVWPPRERVDMTVPITDRLPRQWANPSAEIVAYL